VGDTPQLSVPIRRVDHVGILTERPEDVFRFFSEDLGLPIAFPFAAYPAYRTGSVALGNCFLEITQLGESSTSTRETAARYQILGFEVDDVSIDQVGAAVDAIGIRRSGVVPFFAPDATDALPTRLWDNVYLGELLGTNCWQKLFFAMSRASPPRPSVSRQPLVLRFGVAMLLRAFPSGMPVLTAYYKDRERHARAVDRAPLVECGGGALGVEFVDEVRVTAPETEPWARLLGCDHTAGPMSVRLGHGPAVRVERGRAGIAHITLAVRSVDAAEAALRERGLGPATVDGSPAFLVSGTQVPVRLTSASCPRPGSRE
jgi:catechol 2,3-dioxygenase-like lactoylglutathione lyase family enzyme